MGRTDSTVLYSVLGTSGMRVSKLALGTATFGVAPTEAQADRVIGAAVDAGINLIDTANAYGNLAHFDRPGAPPASERASAEEIIGACLKGRRDELVISTKASEPIGANVNDRGLSRRHLLAQIDRSLSRLRTDHVDIFYAHHPDPDTPIEDTLMTLDDLVRSGKARTYGLSTYPAWATVHALWTADRRNLHSPVCLQVRYSMVARQVETEIVPTALRFGLSLVVFSPLAGGLLTAAASRHRPYRGEVRWGGGTFTESQQAAAEQLETTAGEWGCPPAQLALAWALQRPTIASAIIGPESSEELEEVVGAVDLGAQLSAEQYRRLDEIGATGVADPSPRPPDAP
jgi:aryl-alcohol dehydrogenase-like predicted oxidoreductase